MAATEVFQEILINEPGDQISAEMEDAFREFEEAQQAFREQVAERLKFWELEPDGSINQAVKRREDARMDRARARLEQARANLTEVRRRQIRWMLEEQDGGMRRGYTEAFMELEARQRREMRPVDAQCDQWGEEAHVQLARDYLNGDRASKALTQAQARCDALAVPVRQRHMAEYEALNDRFRITEGDVDEALRTRSASNGASPAGQPRARP